MIDVKGLELKREEPDFLRDEILRRLSPSPEDASSDQSLRPAPDATDGGPCQDCRAGMEPVKLDQKHAADPVFHVFIVVGSPMDFYAFHHFPAIDPAQAENCVVYYLQYQTYGPYATGATDKVSRMLKPLTIHTIKVRSGESVRDALRRIVSEVGEIQ
jgi:hypothetical protein